MNVNPLGISAYGKADVTRKGVDSAQRPQEQFGVDSQKQDGAAVKNSEANRTARVEHDKSVVIARREAETSSSLAVKAKGDFTQLLSPEELDAIDILFSKYTENKTTDASYSAKGQQSHTPRLGARVDFRV